MAGIYVFCRCGGAFGRLEREQSERDKLRTLAGELPSFRFAESVVQQLIKEAEIDRRLSNGSCGWLIHSRNNRTDFPFSTKIDFNRRNSCHLPTMVDVGTSS